jgi:hypothetical protein
VGKRDWFCYYPAKKPSGFLFSEQFKRSGSSPKKKKIILKIELRSGYCWEKVTDKHRFFPE